MIDTKIVTLHTGRCYHPIPFKGYEHIIPSRTDCPERYEAMKKHYDFKGKTILDVGCSLCYFGFRALQDGAKKVSAVDTDINIRNFITDLAKEEKMKLTITSEIPDKHFDVGFYMDTHNAPGTQGFIEKISDKVDILFTSTASVYHYEIDSSIYFQTLQKLFKKVESIYMGSIEKREIFMCSEKI
jgi:2-polyprenyl-3-methyl-5-hydroxy-6-metoxy-1,4-benzoquinol methylase